MVDKNDAIKSSKIGDWELYEVIRDDTAKDLPKDIIIRSDKSGSSVRIPREDFRELVKKYYDRKGYNCD